MLLDKELSSILGSQAEWEGEIGEEEEAEEKTPEEPEEEEELEEEFE
jgi:hypothetical protein